MSENPYQVGQIIWRDITVPQTDPILEFYKQVVGWDFDPVPQETDEGTYDDYNAKDVEGNVVCGICNKRAGNKDLPTQWLMYVHVADLEASLKVCVELGGQVLKRLLAEDGSLQFAVVQDPSGAVIGLI